jgi:hypothetical protein
MGIVSGRWTPEHWKHLLRHHGRIVHACVQFAIAQDHEAIFPYEGDPFGTFEASLVLAAFSIRRLSEKRLLTDSLNETMWSVTMYPSKPEVRPPLPGSTSNAFYQSYQMDKQGRHTLKLRDLGNEIIHSSNLGIVTEPEGLPLGIVVASDNRLARRILHLSLDQWGAMCRAVLDDRVYIASDEWNPDTGETTARRLSYSEVSKPGVR